MTQHSTFSVPCLNSIILLVFYVINFILSDSAGVVELEDRFSHNEAHVHVLFI